MRGDTLKRSGPSGERILVVTFRRQLTGLVCAASGCYRPWIRPSGILVGGLKDATYLDRVLCVSAPATENISWVLRVRRVRAVTTTEIIFIGQIESHLSEAATNVIRRCRRLACRAPIVSVNPGTGQCRFESIHPRRSFRLGWDRNTRSISPYATFAAQAPPRFGLLESPSSSPTASPPRSSDG